MASMTEAAAALGEALALTRHTAAGEIIVVHRAGAGDGDGEMDRLLDRVEDYSEGADLRLHPVSGDPSKRVSAVLEEESVGVVVVPIPETIGRFAAVRWLRRTAAWRRPVLFARGTYPYQLIVAPARETSAGLAAARAAIDIAGSSNGSVTGIAVVPPAFVAGSESREAAVHALTVMREEASVLDVPVRRLLRQGNPVRLMESSAAEADLLVLGRSERRPSILTPGIVGHLLRRVGTSVLVVPGVE